MLFGLSQPGAPVALFIIYCFLETIGVGSLKVEILIFSGLYTEGKMVRQKVWGKSTPG